MKILFQVKLLIFLIVCGSTIMLLIKSIKLKENNASKLIITNLTNHQVIKKDELSHIREQIAEDMEYFQYPNSKNGLSASKLEDFIPELNGTSIKSFIVSKSRSGSSFLGELLNSVPGTFYVFEPLIVNNFPENENFRYLREIFRCSFINKYTRDYIRYNQEFKNYFFQTNKRLFYYCQRNQTYCKSAEALSKICQLFPLYLLKTIRFPLKEVYKLLGDKSLKLKVIFLVRDPRPSIISRIKLNWVQDINPKDACGEMELNYGIAQKLLKKYPESFKVIRYEDLALQPFQLTPKILEFHGLPYSRFVKDFLDTHTSSDKGHEYYSTIRDSARNVFKWITEPNFDKIMEIQQDCEQALKLWGYKLVTSKTDILAIRPFLEPLKI